MATTLDYVKTALEKLGVIAAGETPATPDSDRVLALLNAYIDFLATDGLVIFSTVRSTHSLTASLNPHTIGSGGNINVVRPVRIDKAGIILSGGTAETPLDVITIHEYAAIVDKASEGAPHSLYYDPAYPLGKINLYPEPDTTHTLVLYRDAPLHTTLPLLIGTTITVPPAYQRMLENALTVEIGPLFGVEAAASIVKAASDSLVALKRLNQKTPRLVSDAPGSSGGAYFDIEVGR